MTTTLHRAAAVAIAGATLALAAPATAKPTPNALTGSIVFLKNNNVWIANGDGSGARAVTTDGTRSDPYYSPSESDTGVIAAARSLDIVRMDQHGVVLNRFDPPPLQNSAGQNMDGVPADVAISPDGTRIAWTFVQYDCPGADCIIRSATGYSAADHYQAVGQPVKYRAPSWITNSRTLVTGGYNVQMMLHDITASSAVHWFDDYQLYLDDTDLADGEVSPNGQWLATVRGYSDTTTIMWYRVNGNVKTGAPPAPPSPKCVTNTSPTYASPTWSPDSKALAWQAPGGIMIEKQVGTCGSVRLVLRGGSRPDWSAAPMS